MVENHDWSHVSLGTPATYRIVVRGHLDSEWSDHLGGLEICSKEKTRDSALTILSGRLVDQAALFGVLDGLYRLGFTLLSVECRSEEGP